MYKSFTDMPVWQSAHDLSAEVFELTNSLPRCEDYGLTSKIRRSGNSVSANISEGFVRRSKKNKSYFYVIARGSAFETQNHLLYGNKVGYFDIKVVNQTIENYSSLIYELNKTINTLISQP